jgi:hypothetical protein
MTLEELLKKQGYTDADLAGMGPLLSDQRFRASIEGVVTERDTLATQNEEWQKLHDDNWQPALTAAQNDAIKARREAADAKAVALAAKEYGFVTEDQEREVLARAQQERQQQEQQRQASGFNPDDPKFRDFAGRFSAAEGDAIALHGYLSEEYRMLHGTSINEYRTSINGREVRGMVALRAEAQAARKPIDQYIEEKFNWSGKRAEAEQKRQADHDTKIAREAVEKYAMEHGANPLAVRPQVSQQPLIPHIKQGDKQPWQIPANERRQARLERAYRSEAKASVQ